jgi:signal transduction histidine kinase/CheY-like chemotaxis protein
MNPLAPVLTPGSRFAATAFASYALLGAVVSLLGWMIDAPRLADWDDDGIAIQPNAALAAAVAGATLLLRAAGMQRAALVLGGFVAFMGAATIFQYLSGLDLGIDRLLLFDRPWGRRSVVSPGRMGPVAATCWTLIGAALVLASVPKARWQRWAPPLALVPASISSLSLIGYLYGAGALYTIPTMTAIALQTASFILAVSFAVVVSVPQHGLMRVFDDPRPAGLLTRRFLPVLVLVPVVLGWVQLEGQRGELYDAAFGSALLAIVSVGLYVLVLWLTGRAISRQTESRIRAEEERERLLVLERAARAEADRQATIKDEFLATLSHELRTPLNAILGWVQVLRVDMADPEKARRALDVIERNGRLQTRLIEDLLDMSRIVSGKMRLDVQPTSLPAVIDAAIESIKPAAATKGLRIERVIEPLAEHVDGDPARLQQIVWNLLSNAVKFTPRGGRIEVVLARAKGGVELRVNDTGEGIAPELLASVFDRFRMADAAPSRVHGGLGLGLAVVKQLVELHGGKVAAASDGPGKGAVFVVTLPLAVTPPQDEPPTRPAQAIERSGDFDPPIDLRGARVLIVDDELDSLELLRRVLERSHATVVAARGTDEALVEVRSNGFDVIVSDIGMPRRDGYEFMKECRNLGIATPAIALTAFARAEDRERALSSGYQSHVTKPVETAHLLARVAALVSPQAV